MCQIASTASRGPARVVHVRGSGGLYRGMKDCLGFVVVQRGWVELSQASSPPVREEAGSVRLLRPNELYCEHRRAEDAELDVVLLSPQTVTGEVEGAEQRLAARDPRARAVTRLVHAVRTKASPLELETAVCEATRSLVAEGAPPSSRRQARAVRRAQELLLSRFRENVRLDDLAEHAGLDKFQLVRAFRARHGVPPYEYLTHARILAARRLLMQGARASDVAAEVGYYDQSQLHRHFVRIVGSTPGRYRAGG